MGLNVKEPPESALAIVSEALGNIMGGTTDGFEALTEHADAELNISAPHPLYVVGLSDIAEGKLLAAAVLRGWRYIVLKGDETVGAVNLSFDDQGKNLQFSHISHGPFAQSTVEGIRYAEGLPEVVSNEYELRLLDVPSVYVVSLWLHGKNDRLIPLPPTNQTLKPYEAYSEAEMTAALQPEAIHRLQFE
ncbi:MAG TPA: hypothetical protein VLL54_19395 [Pyrinomonadaceae bacterium]|nr:hypothetical protein [Pyrinomonadaceae bacterium]